MATLTAEIAVIVADIVEQDFDFWHCITINVSLPIRESQCD